MKQRGAACFIGITYTIQSQTTLPYFSKQVKLNNVLGNQVTVQQWEVSNNHPSIEIIGIYLTLLGTLPILYKRY